MNKNLIIIYLIISIIILIGYIMLLNYPLLSEVWLISLMIILGSIGLGVGIVWIKRKR